MYKPFLNEIYRLGGDPSDEIWGWLANTGPHGDGFTWGQTRNEPPGYVGVVHLATIVAEMEISIADFKSRAREVVRVGMRSEIPELLRRSIQVAAVVGGEDELIDVQQLMHSEDLKVASDAKACAFYIKRVLRS
ncbi:MAG: hypothetical protein EOP02_14150 [Proteobacteria bacterium]|nr:MAG: hypothetical protein EOP02_14150 [Pseudomonadota bacterium]